MASNQPEGQTRDRRRDVRVVSFTLAVVLLIWFAIANSQTVPVHFWVVSAHVSLVSVILISGALGALIALLASRRSRRAKAGSR